ncbi:transglycosylase family protein [Ferrimicrobium acidiphilum]|uniref:transglycosylase family protein n=1 Tax=Ferrimicrobium acidiphilum TaxID=121039 RepID=UPI003C6DA976
MVSFIVSLFIFSTTSQRSTIVPVGRPLRTFPVTFASLSQPWRCIAYRESSDRVSVVNPVSGDGGAFQIATLTWREYRRNNYPLNPEQATLAQQYTVAKRIEKADGWWPWVTAPLCGV